MPVRVVEFRNYRLKPGVREAFIDYFEERFLDSQEDVGMRVLGQFRLVGEPAENDFPRLPVIQEPGLFVILSLDQDGTEDRSSKPAFVEHPEISEILELEPTDRSALGNRLQALAFPVAESRDRPNRLKH